MQQEEKYIYMTETPVPRLIGELAVPTIISMLVTSFYNMVDTFFVGKIDRQSTAAVGIVFSVMALIQALGFFSDTVPGIIFQGVWERKILKKRRQWRRMVFSCFSLRAVRNGGRTGFLKTVGGGSWLNAYHTAIYGRLFENHSDRSALYDLFASAE